MILYLPLTKQAIESLNLSLASNFIFYTKMKIQGRMKVFDQNDLTKAAFEPVLLTPLQRAQKDGYVNIIGAEGKKKIEYITLEKHVENYEDPEEKVRANFFAELIYKYEYPANRIKVEVIVPDRLPVDRADIVVFSDDDCKRPYAIVE